MHPPSQPMLCALLLFSSNCSPIGRNCPRRANNRANSHIQAAILDSTRPCVNLLAIATLRSQEATMSLFEEPEVTAEVLESKPPAEPEAEQPAEPAPSDEPAKEDEPVKTPEPPEEPIQDPVQPAPPEEVPNTEPGPDKLPPGEPESTPDSVLRDNALNEAFIGQLKALRSLTDALKSDKGPYAQYANEAFSWLQGFVGKAESAPSGQTGA